MAKSTSKSKKINPSTQSSGLRNAILFLPLIAIIGLVWLIMVNLGRLPESLTFGQDFKTWLNIWVAILIIIIVVLFCIPQTGESGKALEVAEAQPEPTRKVNKVAKSDQAATVTVEPEEKPVEFLAVSKEALKEKKLKAEEAKVEPVAEEEVTEKEEKTIEAKADLLAASVVAKPAGKGKIKPHIIEYPSDVEGGIYGDTFIELGNEKVLKLRTIVVKDIYLL
jgi:hypothetical protein